MQQLVQKRQLNLMQRLFKTIGVFDILALTLAAVAETAAALADKDIISDQTVCSRGLNSERSVWTKDSFYAEEAAHVRILKSPTSTEMTVIIAFIILIISTAFHIFIQHLEREGAI